MKQAGATYRKPSYSAAVNLARIVDEMSLHPFGWGMEDLADYLRVSVRTVRRYIKVLETEFLGEDGDPQFLLERRDEEMKLIRRSRPREDLRQAMPDSIYHLISVHLSLEYFKMLGHNVVALSVEDVFHRAETKLTAKQRDLLRELPRKFFTAPWAPKDYSDKVDILEDVIKAIVYQNVIKIFYKKPGENEPWHYTLEPWTLLYHKGGFYLVARSIRHKHPVYFNLERIQSLEVLKDKFDYPKNYHPEQMLDGAFGIFSGPAKTFKLKFSPKVAEYVIARKWHKSQKIQRKRDGSLVLTLKVADSEEVKSWIRSFGKEVKILKP